MSDLINIGLSATRAYSASLRMVGENIANADDPAYVRRRVQLAEVAMATSGSPLFRPQLATNGVEITGIGRSVDPLIDAALRRAETTSAQSGQRADWQARIETAIDDGEFAVGARITAFFTAGARAVATPDDPALRLEMLGALERVGSGFAATAERIDALDGDLNGAAATRIADLNANLATLAGVNRDLRAARPGSSAQAQLFDRRDQMLRAIGADLPVTISYDRHGAASLDAGGVAIVPGITAETLSVSRTGAGGVMLSTAGGASVPVNGGAFAGLDAAGQTIRQRRSELDAQAAGFAGAVNGWNAFGATPADVSGGPLLTGTLATDLALATSDPAAIAAATPGGNPAGNLLALAGLRGSGGSEAAWSSYVNRVALDTRNARADAEAAAIMADRAAAARDTVSGVDLDMEAAEMLRLQQAYGAAARILQVARDTVQTILDIV